MVEDSRTPTLEELRSLHQDFEREHKRRLTSLKRRKKKINELVTFQTEEESATRGIVNKKYEVLQKIFARTAISPELVNARDVLIRKYVEAENDQITVARRRALKQGIQNYEPQLQKLCPHPFVFSYDGHKSYSSYEESTHGHRICVVCNLWEESKGAPEDIYTSLDDNGMRMVLRDLREKSHAPTFHSREWFTVDFLQKLFENSAGSNNVEWPTSFPIDSVLRP